MIKAFIGILLVFIASMAQSQNVLGFSEDEVKTYFKLNYPDLIMETNTKNDIYRYLKYSDLSTNLITALVFIDKEGLCSAVRFIYDLSMENEIIEELNTRFKKTEEEYVWIDSARGRKKVKIFFKKEDWFITVNYKEE